MAYYIDPSIINLTVFDGHELVTTLIETDADPFGEPFTGSVFVAETLIDGKSVSRCKSKDKASALKQGREAHSRFVDYAAKLCLL